MNKLGRKLRIMVLIAAVLTIGNTFVLPNAEAAPVACSGPIIAFGRQRWCGYFKNIGYDSGQFVRIGGIPSSVNTAQEFINLIVGDLNSGNAHRKTAAEFLILTMIGRGPGPPQSVSAAQLADWQDRVKSYANSSENG